MVVELPYEYRFGAQLLHVDAACHGIRTVEQRPGVQVGGKMFAIAVLEPAKVWLSFKCFPEEFAELVERPGIIPAPYSARYHWIALETEEALTVSELKTLLRRSYDLVVAKLPKKVRTALGL